MTSPRTIRQSCRKGKLTGQTSALAPGFLQANLALIPEPFADEFEAFANANQATLPILARGRAGDPRLPELGSDIDLRTDLPRYRVLIDGRPTATDPTEILYLWRNDLVAFAIGCSLSFEADLVASGVPLRCYGENVSCSAFDSKLPMIKVGPFGGNLVVTMRAVRQRDVKKTTEITRAHPAAHGAPVHIGDAGEIGVDLSKPIDGLGLTDVLDGEVSMFWPCGVSLERAIRHAAPDLAITHAPGHMLITDLPAHPIDSEWWSESASIPA